MNIRLFISSTLAIAMLPVALYAQPRAKTDDTKELFLLTERIRKVIDSAHCHIGVAAAGVEFGDKLSIGGNEHFPMHSVFKFPLAITILRQVDLGILSMEQRIHVPKESLDTSTWSPLRKDFPDRDIDISIKELLTYTISKSDNNGCDILFGVAGGTAVVNKYVHDSIGITGINIVATEREMKASWPVQYTNWCEPVAMVQLLQRCYRGKLLSKASTDFLLRIMTESENSANRIKGELPEGTIVAHKTGTSGTNYRGVTAATNDVGVITLPDGRHIAMVIYVSDYKGGVFRGEYLIADIAKMIWDVMAKK